MNEVHYGAVYQILNLADGKRYIGASGNPTKRIREHKSALRNGIHKNKKLQQAWNELADKNDFIFEVIEDKVDVRDLYELEMVYCNKFDTVNQGYNPKVNTPYGRRDRKNYTKNFRYFKEQGGPLSLKDWRLFTGVSVKELAKCLSISVEEYLKKEKVNDFRPTDTWKVRDALAIDNTMLFTAHYDLHTLKQHIKMATKDDIKELKRIIKEGEIEIMEKNITMKDLTLTQAAYLAGTNDRPHYEAAATDMDGNQYQVRWSIREDYDPAYEQEDMACDWDKPESIQKL